MSVAYAINAFKFETQNETKTCVIGKIPMQELEAVQDRSVTTEKDGIYLLQKCRVQGGYDSDEMK